MINLPLRDGQFEWHYSGMVADIRTAIAGRANFLAALGLLIYTEVLGRDVLRRRGVKKPGREQSFYCFWEEFMGLPRRPGEKIYEHFRHGLGHTYEFLAARVSVVAMHPDPDAIPPAAVAAVDVSSDGALKTLQVNGYWRDFQRGLTQMAVQYPDILRMRLQDGEEG